MTSGARAWRLVMLCLVLIPCNSIVHAQDDVARDEVAVTPLLFRREFIPERNIDEFARDTIPLRRDQFEKMVTALRQQPKSVRASIIESFSLAARYTSGSISGLGRVSVRSGNNSDAFISLAPSRLPINFAWWSEDFAEIPLGYDPTGRLGVVVDRSGEWMFDWALSPTTRVDRAEVFDFDLPTSAFKQVLLVVPKDYRVTISHGLATRLEGRSLADWSWWNEIPGDDEVSWLIRTGSDTRVSIRVEPVAASPEKSTESYRQSTSVELSQRATKLSSSFQFGSDDKPQSAVLSWPAGYQLLSISHGQQELAWELLESKGDPTRQTARVDFPITSTFFPATIQCDAIGPSVVGTQQPLPKIRLDNANWREGRVEVLVIEPLRLVGVELKDSQLEAVEAETQADRRLAIREFSDSASIQLSTQIEESVANCHTAAMFRFMETSVRGDFIARLSAHQGSRFELKAKLGAGWAIDSLEATAKDDNGSIVTVLRDWSVAGRGEGETELNIRLERPLSKGHDVQLRLVAQRDLEPLGDTISLANLQPLEVQLPTARRLFAFHAASARQLRLRSSSFASILTRAELASELRAFEHESEISEANCVALTSSLLIPNIKFELVNAKPRFRTNTASHWAVATDSISASHRIECMPESVEIERLELRVASKDPTPHLWTIEGDDDVTVTPRLLHDDSDGALWELTIYPPRKDTFALLGERTVLRTGPEINLGLISFPNSSQQSADVIVEGASPLVAYGLSSEGLQRSPITGDNANLLFAKYRYHGTGERKLVVKNDDAMLTPSTHQLWLTQVETLVSPQSIKHIATLYLERFEGDRVSIQLPTGVRPRRVTIDSNEIPWTLKSETSRMDLWLPDNGRFHAVTLEYDEATSTSWHLWQRVYPRFPGTESEPLDHRWIVKCAPNVEIWRESGQSRSDLPRSGWHEKLLGVLTPSSDIGMHQGPAEQTNPGPWRSSATTIPQIETWASHDISITYHAGGYLLATNTRYWHILALGLIVTSTGVSLVVCRRNPTRIIIVVAGSAAFCLTAPAMCAVATSGLFLGSLIAAAWIGFGRLPNIRRVQENENNPREQSTASIAQATLTLTAIAVAATFTIDADGTSLGQSPRDKAPNVHPVYVPVDADGQPSGDYVHVNADFYAALHRRFSDQRAPSVDWLLHSARTSIKVVENDDTQEQNGRTLNVLELKYSGELSIFRNDRSIELPFRQDQLSLVTGSAMIDGIPVEADWNEIGDRLVVTSKAIGRARFEVTFLPRLSTVDGQDVLEVNGPSSARSRMVLTHPPGVSGFQLDPNIELTAMAAERMSAELGAIGHWRLAFPSRAELANSVAAEQLTWLKLQSGSVICNVRFNYIPAEEPIRWVEWAVAPGLKPLSVSVNGAELGRFSLYQARRRFNIELIEPCENPFVVDATFLVTDATGIGTVEVPQIVPTGCQLDRHWLAISSDKSLEVDVDHGDLTEPIAVNQFNAAWGGDQTPSRAFRMLAARPDLSIRVLPDVGQSPQTLETWLTIGKSSMRLDYKAIADTRNGVPSFYQFDLPPDFEMVTATILGDNGPVDHEVAIDGTRLTLFVTDSTSKQHVTNLSLIGPKPVESFRLPRIVAKNQATSGNTFRIYRTDEVLVDLAETPDDNSSVVSSVGVPHGSGRFVSEFALAPDATADRLPVLLVRPNQVQLQNSLLALVLVHASDGWRLRIALRGKVQAGVVDSIRLAVPSGLGMPEVLSPNGTIESFLVSTTGMTHWHFRPAVEITGNLHVDLEVPVVFNSGDSPELPQIRIVDMNPEKELVLLPREMNGQAINWNVSNLDLTPPPVSLITSLEFEPAADCYLASGEYRARMTSPTADTVDPQVRLATVSVIATNRNYFGTAGFDLEPGGLDYCDVEVPAGVKVHRVLVDNKPVAVIGRSNGDVEGLIYRCLLGKASLARNLEVLFSGNTSEADISISVPTLINIPVERTLWAVRGPTGTRLAANSSIGEIDAKQHAAFHVRALATLAEPPDNFLTTVSKEELLAWYQPWVRRLRMSYETGRSSSAKSEYPFDEEFTNERLEMAARMGVETAFVTAFDRSPEEEIWTLPACVNSIARTSVQPILAVSQGASDHIDLEVPQTNRFPWHLTAALCVMAIAIAGYLTVRNRDVSEWIVWWLHPVGVLIGVGWWLWLTPSFIGWIIVAIALLGSLRTPWRMRPVA